MIVYLKLLEDPAYLKHHQEISQHDKVIIRRVFILKEYNNNLLG